MRKGTTFTCQMLLYACFILLPATLFGQEYGKYKLKLSIFHLVNVDNGLKRMEFKVSSVSWGEGERELLTWITEDIEEMEWLDNRAPAPIVATYDCVGNKRPNKLRFWGKRVWSKFLWIEDSREGTNELTLDVNKPHLNFSATVGNDGEYLFPSVRTWVTVELLPVSIKLHYYTGTAPGSANDLNLLPDNDYITLKATKGFVPKTYKWQYFDPIDNRWYDMPNTLQYKEEITFKGTDIFLRDKFNELVRNEKNVFFRINAITDERRNEADYWEIALTPTYSAPYISRYEVTQERCNGSGDASVHVFLNRKLWLKENLSYFLNNEANGKHNVDAEANSFTINNLTAGEYTINLIGSHDGINKQGLLTYRATDNHTTKVTIPERQAIKILSFAIEKEVSCYAGHDGAITLSAEGGTGNFTGVLTDEHDAFVQEQKFNAGNTPGNTLFTKLPEGTYKVRVEDSNRCEAKTDSRIKLKQPDKAVFIEEINKISPLAHQSPDGTIQIAVSGGTPSTDGYTVRFVRTSDRKEFAPTDTMPEYGQYIYTLGNIPRGEYTAIAQDMRYASLANEDQQEPCGCQAKLSIALTAPPPLSVKIEETRVISCHGSSNGELTAHGKGGIPNTATQLPYTYSWFKITDGSVPDTLDFQTDSIARNLAAGKYKVKLTDANNVSVESAVFELKQPTPLDLTLATQPPSCSRGSGLITTTVTGGTAPYAYEWNKEGATEAELTIDEAGSYFVRVVDSRGCSIRGSVDVTAPDAITIKPTITHPTCHDAENGAIALDLEGGTAPYSIQWEDSPTITSMQRKNLAAGEYTAVVSDQFGCSLRYRVVLEQPDALVVKLDKGFTLCHGQSQKITAQSNDEDATYQWSHNGRTQTETAKELLVTEAGRYQVLVTNKEGCTATDEVEIKTSNTDLPLDITAPTTVTVGASIHAVNISLVKADRLEWRLPENAVVTRQSDEGVIFSIPKPGIYEIQLIGYLNDCSTVITQRLEVLDEGAVVLPDGKEEQILQLLVTPNSVLF